MPAKSSSDADLVELGRVSGVFGVHGELRLFLHNRESDLLDGGRAVILTGPDGSTREVLLSARPGTAGRVLGKIDGVRDRDAAAALKDWTISIPIAALPSVDEDEFYIRDVLEAEVVVDGEVVGHVRQVHSSGPVEIFEVILVDGAVGFCPVIGSHVLEIAPGRVVLATDALAVDG